MQTVGLQTMSLFLVDSFRPASLSRAMTKAPSSASGAVIASVAKFIKLGESGAWEELCLEDGTLRLAYYEAPHEMGLAGDREGIQEIYLNLGLTKGTASDHARQVLDFYHAPADTVWITFHKGSLWWCRARPEVEFLGQDREAFPGGSRLRRTLDGWHNASLGGQPLRQRELNGRLTRTAAYRATICDVGALDYLLAKINDEDLPVIGQAKAAKATALTSIQALMNHLTWQDFELLVDLVFAQSGWRRVGETGGTQKTVDIELELPSTGEHAFVQVKSATNQSQLDDYVARMDEVPGARMFYAYHTASGPLATVDPRVTLVGPEQLSELALDAGLFNWLIQKIG